MQGVDQPGECAIHRLRQAEAARRLQRHEAVQGGTLLPGHGGPWTGGVPEAVAAAKPAGRY